jgi:hypothetical protein
MRASFGRLSRRTFSLSCEQRPQAGADIAVEHISAAGMDNILRQHLNTSISTELAVIDRTASMMLAKVFLRAET